MSFLLPPTTLFSERSISAHPSLTLLLPLALCAKSPQSVLHVEYMLVCCTSFGNFTSSLQIHCDRVSVQSFPYLLSEHHSGGFQMSATKWKITLGTGSSSWCCAVVAIGGKKYNKHLVIGKVTPSSTTKKGIYSTVQFSASSCADKSMLTEQALSGISRKNRGDKSLKRRKGGVGNAWELGCLVFKCMFQVKTCDLLFKCLRESRNGLRLLMVLVCMISESQV